MNTFRLYQPFWEQRSGLIKIVCTCTIGPQVCTEFERNLCYVKQGSYINKYRILEETVDEPNDEQERVLLENQWESAELLFG